MAKGTKKKETLTPEEKLQQALVPVEEQPYPVPENWCWMTIKEINQYKSCSIDPSKEPQKKFELYSVPSSANNYPELLYGIEIGSTKQSVQKNDVLLCKINPRINRVWIVDQYTEYQLIASSEWIIIRNQQLNAQFLMYCFRTPYFRDYMLSNVSGVGGSLMRAQPKFVNNYPIPLPPLPEQQRIVVRIESLFAKLDEVKEKAQAVVDGYEDRKAAILHKAFTGELTAKWREEKGISLDSWRNRPIGELTDITSSKRIYKDEYTQNGIPFYRSSEIVDLYDKGFTNPIYFISKNRYEEIKNKYGIPLPGDLLVTSVGTIGKTWIVDNRAFYYKDGNLTQIKQSILPSLAEWSPPYFQFQN